MAEFPMSHAVARGLALAHAAESMLRAVGGSEAVFCLPVALTSENPTRRELGLEPVPGDNIAVSPVAVLTGSQGFELLISPTSLEQHLHLRAQTAEQFFEEATSVQVLGRSLRIQSYRGEMFAERVYLYRISAVE